METGSQAPKKKMSRPFEALLSLHHYLDSCNLREVVSKLLLLPQESLIIPSRKGTGAELSVYGHAAVQILTESKANSPQDHSMFLSQAHLHGLGTLLLSCSSPALEAFLLQTLSAEPGSAKLIHTDVLLHCLQWPLPNTLAISSLLLQNCSTHRLCFELWCLEPANMKKLSEETETFLSLISTYLQVSRREDPARPQDGLSWNEFSFVLKHLNSLFVAISAAYVKYTLRWCCCVFTVQKEVLEALKQALLGKLSQCVLGNPTEASVALPAEILASLMELSASIKDTTDMIHNLPNALQQVDNFERY